MHSLVDLMTFCSICLTTILFGLPYLLTAALPLHPSSSLFGGVHSQVRMQRLQRCTACTIAMSALDMNFGDPCDHHIGGQCERDGVVTELWSQVFRTVVQPRACSTFREGA